MYYLSRSSLLYAILYFFFYKHKIILHVMCYVEDLHSNKYLLDSRICGNIYGFKLGISTKKKKLQYFNTDYSSSLFLSAKKDENK